MMTLIVMMALFLTIIMALTIDHLPLCLKRVFYYAPPWLVAAIIHFGYGAYLGGVTGHMTAALVSVPMFLILRFWLRPRIRQAMDEAWSKNPIHRLMGTKAQKVSEEQPWMAATAIS